jgi:hypothetical protein
LGALDFWSKPFFAVAVGIVGYRRMVMPERLRPFAFQKSNVPATTRRKSQLTPKQKSHKKFFLKLLYIPVTNSMIECHG